MSQDLHARPQASPPGPLTIDYFFSPQSPWTYLGHQRFAALAQQHGARVRVLPVDLGQVFPVSGGVPVGKRAPQRQVYRLLELRRVAEYLALPMHPQPKYFPVASGDAARLIVAADQREGTPAAMRLCGAVFAAVWAQQRNIADPKVLAALLDEAGLPAALLEQSLSQAAHERYEANTEEAIAAGVFGAPSYVVGGEIFWGQDRLDFLQRKLQRHSSPGA
ncbi:2-hydroxychromene-2-carboxylate isomerase [Xylophilus sp. GW821-FHT01B05]